MACALRRRTCSTPLSAQHMSKCVEVIWWANVGILLLVLLAQPWQMWSQRHFAYRPKVTVSSWFNADSTSLTQRRKYQRNVTLKTTQTIRWIKVDMILLQGDRYLQFDVPSSLLLSNSIYSDGRPYFENPWTQVWCVTVLSFYSRLRYWYRSMD